MIGKDEAKRLAEDWVSAWNRRDIEAVLTHYAENVTLQSPLALQRFGLSDGRVSGKEAVRAYFQRGLELSPDLHFELIDVLLGVEGMIILYRRENNALVADVAILNDHYQVTEYRAYYGLEAMQHGDRQDSGPYDDTNA